jgi:hypothetical protein
MTKTQRDAIATPATGLLVFQTNSTPGFYYYSGSAWTAVSPKGTNKTLNNLTAPTAVNVELLPGTDNSINLGSTLKQWKDIYAAGSFFIEGSKFIDASGSGNTFLGNTSNTTNSGANNTFTGYAAGLTNTSGGNNSFYGFGSGAANSTGTDNTYSGFVSGYANNEGSFNSFFGSNAGLNNSASENSFFGSNAGYSNTSGTYNVAVGSLSFYYNTTGSNNTACGYSALNKNTTGNNNLASGYAALSYNTDGYSNTAEGSEALSNNTTGYKNTANGNGALFRNGLGSDNTASGYQALYVNFDGLNNTAVGSQALYNSNSSHNTATGYQSLYSSNTGNGNTAYGDQALYYNAAGFQSTATGLDALYNNTSGWNNCAHGVFGLFTNKTGANNTAFGSFADVLTDNLFNATAIGYVAYVDASNKVRIGNNSVTSIGGEVGWTNFSDGRIKNNVKENVPGLEFINLLKPVTYNFNLEKEYELMGRKDTTQWEGKNDIEKINFTGFIAQEVDAAAKKINYDFSGVDKSGNIMGLRYSEFVVPLVKAVQELSGNDDVQMSKLADVQMENENLKLKNDELEKRIAAIENQSSTNSGMLRLATDNQQQTTALLGQNIPNPFDNSTLIPFRIPKNCHDASIMITNTSTSEVINVIPISCNQDHLSIDAGTLASGTYSYTLYVDGKVIGTKNMVLQK